VREFAQVFHVGAIIELIENDDLMNEQEEEEEEEEVKFNKLSVVFHPKKEREKERKREKETHIIIAVKNLIDPLFASKRRRKGDDRGALPSTEKNYKHSADDNDVNDDDDKEEEEDRFFAHLAVRVLLREEDGHVGGDKASPAGD
jgi:hypothetical protein